MTFNYQTKEYPGVQLRPRSEIIPCGNNSALDILQQTISDKFSQSHETQVTAVSTDMFLPSYSSQKLKAVLKEANSSILERINKNSYVSALEATLLNYKENILSWVQVGQPSLLLLRDGKIIILSAGKDLSLDYSQSESLPSELIGIESTLSANFSSIVTQPDDIFILFSGKHIPSSFLGIKKFKKDLTDLTAQLFDSAAKENKDSSFWISCFNF
jgi:hypothetical protein